MKSLILTFLALISINADLNAQVENNHKIIRDELRLLDIVFDDLIFLGKEGPYKQEKVFNWIKYDTIPIWKIDCHHEYLCLMSFVKISVNFSKLQSNMPPPNLAQLLNDTLVYYILSGLNETYKIFGFYNSDIRKLETNVIKNSYFDSLENYIVKLNILDANQAKLYIKTIKDDTKGELPTELNKPCNLLKYYFSDNEANNINTIILPGKPFILW